MAEQLRCKDSVMYAIDIPSFQDGNRDGIEGIQGATSRIDDLGELGINCIWPMPFYKSPFCDNGGDRHEGIHQRPGEDRLRRTRRQKTSDALTRVWQLIDV